MTAPYMPAGRQGADRTHGGHSSIKALCMPMARRHVHEGMRISGRDLGHPCLAARTTG